LITSVVSFSRVEMILRDALAKGLLDARKAEAMNEPRRDAVARAERSASPTIFRGI
jgi:hypothetical protein